MKVKYNGIENLDAVRWGANDDPAKYLRTGVEYEVDKKEVHGWHTKIFLVDFPGKKFNSVHFVEV